MADPVRMAPKVALLGRDDAVRAQLRSALAELGATLVFEGDIVGADAAKVASASPDVVLLNLDSEGEDALDRMDSLLLDPSMKVVFNEAETTASLSGWDLARWARHLAAKVLGHDQTIPPPPAGSEYSPETGLQPTPGAPPTPESQSAPLSIQALEDEASLTLGSVPSSATLSTAGADLTQEDGEDPDQSVQLGALDVDEIDLALTRGAEDVSDGPAANVDPNGADAVVQSDTQDSLTPEDESSLSIDMSDVADALARIDAENPPVERSRAERSSAAELVDTQETGNDSAATEFESMIDFDSSALGELTPLELDDAVDSELEPPIRMNFASDVSDTEESEDLDEAVAALAAQLDSLDDSTPKGEMAVRDPDFFFDKSADDEPPSQPAASRGGAGRKASSAPHDFSLEDELTEVQTASSRVTTEAPAIDISHLTLEDLPDPGLVVEPKSTRHKEDEPYVPRPGIDLELAPLGSFSDQPVEDRKSANRAVKADVGDEDELQELDLSLSPLDDDEEAPATAVSGIRRVLVLGASIGGPDALRTFLGGLPVGFPALVVLAQHLESGFFDRLAQQLQKVCKLPVRVSTAGHTAKETEVLIIPSGERVLIDPSGRVSHQPHSEPTHYRPCIDDVMRDIADQFGGRATAIIFSGMAGDAVEGAVYLTSKGGEVWAQNPDSCVVSSMVDGAQARGVVEFVGTPRELADRCMTRYGNPA